MDFLTEHFAVFGFEFQYWIPIVIGACAIYIVWLWLTGEFSSGEERMRGDRDRQSREGHAGFEEGTDINPGAPGRAPVDKYDVVVTQRRVASWEWEIHCNNEPLTVPLWDGPFESARAAEDAGAVALRELLKTVDQLEGD
jgi:hypothetical protein